VIFYFTLSVIYLDRERNREHAKRSRVRKKFLLESLQQSVKAVQNENERLRASIRHYLPDEADKLLTEAGGNNPNCLATSQKDANTTLNDPDYSLVKALQTAQQSFIITDPSLPDNPLVYASSGFLELTGYTIDQVLGRNCRFLQGPQTDLRAVDRIREGIEKGEDTTVVLLNYKNDGTKFWNQFFVAALRDGDGNIVNFLGVQCKVSEEYALAFLRKQKIEDGKII
jgi:PAS domain S-box-containing protein